MQNTLAHGALAESKEVVLETSVRGLVGLLRRPWQLMQANSQLLLTFGSHVNTLYNSSGPPWLTTV